MHLSSDDEYGVGVVSPLVGDSYFGNGLGRIKGYGRHMHEGIEEREVVELRINSPVRLDRKKISILRPLAVLRLENVTTQNARGLLPGR